MRNQEEMHEIERKFIGSLDDLPRGYDASPYEDQKQGYLVISKKGNEVRIRKAEPSQGNVEYSLTFKAEKMPRRVEVPIPLTQAQFEKLWVGLEREEKIFKRRYFYEDGGHTYHVNIFEDRFRGKLMIEVEFDSMNSYASFIPPPWLQKFKEVTGDSRYQVQNIVQYGFPED